MYRARLEFNDGAVVELGVEPGETVAEAAMRAEAPLRTDCLSGECGACLAHCAPGARVEGEKAAVVSREEAAEGLVATCCTRLSGDVELALDYALHPMPSEPAKLRGVLESHEMVCASVSRLAIRLDDVDGFTFQPGQYLRLRPPGMRAARAYSIASTPVELPLITLLIRHVEGGQVGAWLRDKAAPGDRLVLQAPLGGFAADHKASRQVFIAGGTGLAPVLSMIAAQRGSGREMVLCFGCTRPEDLFMADELARLADAIPELDLRIALVHGANGTIRPGHAVSLLGPQDFVPGSVFHLCGPPGMIDAARATLRENGVPARAIRSERFLVST